MAEQLDTLAAQDDRVVTRDVYDDRWIQRFHESADDAIPLVCFPHAGGSASFFHQLSTLMPPTVQVLAVQYPGRQDRRLEKCLESVAEIADQVADVLRPLPARPFFFGHSMGASVAFETARRLEHAPGGPLSGLFVSGRRPPSLWKQERVHERSDADIIAELRDLDGTDARLFDDEEFLAMVLPVLRADYKVAETYRLEPGITLSCPIAALTGDNDPRVTVEEAKGWSEHTTGPFDCQVFPGGHFYLVGHWPAVAAALAECMASSPDGDRVSP